MKKILISTLCILPFTCFAGTAPLCPSATTVKAFNLTQVHKISKGFYAVQSDENLENIVAVSVKANTKASAILDAQKMVEIITVANNTYGTKGPDGYYGCTYKPYSNNLQHQAVIYIWNKK